MSHETGNNTDPIVRRLVDAGVDTQHLEPPVRHIDGHGISRLPISPLSVPTSQTPPTPPLPRVIADIAAAVPSTSMSTMAATTTMMSSSSAPIPAGKDAARGGNAATVKREPSFRSPSPSPKRRKTMGHAYAAHDDKASTSASARAGKAVRARGGGRGRGRGRGRGGASNTANGRSVAPVKPKVDPPGIGTDCHWPEKIKGDEAYQRAVRGSLY